MNQLGILIATNLCEKLWRLCVNAKCLIDFLLATIDIGERGGINQKIEVESREFLSHSIEVSEIELGAAETDDFKFVAVLAHERGTQSTASADNYDSHVVAAGVLTGSLNILPPETAAATTHRMKIML